MYTYGCFNRAEGAVIILELEEFKLPMSLKDLPGFIMNLVSYFVLCGHHIMM